MELRSGLVLAVVSGALLQAAPALAAPPNDNFASAQPLSGTSTSATGTTVEATLEPPNEPPHFAGNGSVWYTWTAPTTAMVQLSACDATKPLNIQMYSGSTLVGLGATEVQRRSEHPRCNGLTGEDLYLFNVVGGATYRISVIEYVSANDSSFTLNLSTTPTPNDAFATPQDLGQDPNVDVDGTTTGSTLEAGEDDRFGNQGDGDSVWYRWTAPRKMRVWIDNCNAASDSKVTVYTGSSLGSLEPVGEHFGLPPVPSCEGGGGARSEFLATAGTIYRIRVYTDLYHEGGFHLRMREIDYDGSLTQYASATKIKKGKTVTYTIGVKNLGTVPIDPWVELITTKPNKFAGKVDVKYVSMETTNGKCIDVKWFGSWPGGICKLNLPAGASATIVAKVKASESFSHWVEFDYAHGGDNPLYDDERGNETDEPATTTVKKKRKHHH
ncbi:MAG: hypothetical protein QOI10_3330 [Solirubrobacterales bacterium]|jgi:hypothetical protein|nr:hypothetical protein [Solirubrobacterales bacterium]